MNFENLQKFMFSKNNLIKYYTLLDNNILTNKINNKFEFKKKINNNLEFNNTSFLISQKDKYFWAFYIIFFTYSEYHLISNYFTVEKEFKINSVIKIRENKNLLKINKISRNIIENELVNENVISLKTLNCLALIYSLNIIFIKEEILFIMNYNKEDINKCKNIIELKNNKIYLIEISEEKLKNLIQNNFIIQNINKPLNSISFYKLSDLNIMCKKLNISINSKLKINLYSEIQIKLSNFI